MSHTAGEQLTRMVAERASALVLYARQWCGSPEDVVQTAFLKLVRLRARPDSRSPLRPCRDPRQSR